MPIIWTLVARTGPVLILDDSVTVEGGLFMPFGVWFAPNGAVCIADATRGVLAPSWAWFARNGSVWLRDTGGGLGECYSHHLMSGLYESAHLGFVDTVRQSRSIPSRQHEFNNITFTLPLVLRQLCEARRLM